MGSWASGALATGSWATGAWVEDGGGGGGEPATGNSFTLVYTIGRTIEAGETITLAYTQPGDGVEDVARNDLVTFSGQSVTNNSNV